MSEYIPSSEVIPAKLQAWIHTNIIPRKTPNQSESSYSLKHRFEVATGCYTDNETFKCAMSACGFAPVNVTEQNHHYCISNRSPALQYRCM